MFINHKSLGAHDDDEARTAFKGGKMEEEHRRRDHLMILVYICDMILPKGHIPFLRMLLTGKQIDR